MGPWCMPGLTSSRSPQWFVSLTLAVLLGTLSLTSSLDHQAGVLETGKRPGKLTRESDHKQQDVLQLQSIPKKMVPIPKHSALNNHNEINNNVINGVENRPDRIVVNKVAVLGLPVNSQALARQQKERLAENERINNEFKSKLRRHEEEHEKRERQIQEREVVRQQRQQLLEDFRKAELNSKKDVPMNQEQKRLNDPGWKPVVRMKEQQPQYQNIKLPNPAQKVEGGASNVDSHPLRNEPPKRVADNIASDNINTKVKERVGNVLGDLDGNRVLPVVKYPREDDSVNNNKDNNANIPLVNAHGAQDSNSRQHDLPEADGNPPVIKVEERRDVHVPLTARPRNEFDQGFNNNDRENFNQRNAEFNENSESDTKGDGQLGGFHINWDWDDFSIMFDNYGRAEQKVRRGPKATTGEPWPLPQYYTKKEKKVYKIGKDLRFVPTGVTCDVIEEALARHLQRILKGNVEDMYDNLQNAEGSPISDPSLRYEKEEFLRAPLINRVEIKVRKPCTKYPSLESDESYDLVVKKKKTFIYANEVWGLLRGLETFGHLVWRGTDGHLYAKESVISDYPRFAHRGLHIDTSRHFLFKEVLLDIIDSMEMNKFNVFHWHIVDDQSFPYESKVFPELSRKGAFHPTYVYSLEDITELIEYARLRGVRVLPEFDTPGHTYAWGLGRPDLLTQCFSDKTPVKGYLGPLDPSKNSTYRFLHSIFQEIMGVFKDTHLHLGGDEVPLGCWQSNPEIMAFANELARKNRQIQAKNPQQQQQMQQNYYNSNSWNQWSDEIKQVYEYYENRLIKMLTDIAHKKKKPVHYIMWQEVINNNLQLPNDTIIQVWMGDMGDVMRATSMGYRVIYSTCWYLDHIEYGTKWPKYYQCDPVDQSYGYHIDEKKVIGGEAAFWSEYFTNENLLPLMWPRASAIAERLWSNKEVKNLDKAAERLSEHRCRMIKRGINAGEINGPGYCLHSPPKRRMFNESAGCKGGNCSRSHNFVEIEDIQVHLSQRGGSLTDCGKLFHHGTSSVPILLGVILVLLLALIAVGRSSSRLHRMRLCKNRFILLAFVMLLLVYFLCHTTIWMRAFEFSGSIHKTVQEDKSDKSVNAESFNDQNFLPS